MLFNTILIDEDSLARHYPIVLIRKPSVPYREDTVRIKDFATFRLGLYIEYKKAWIICPSFFTQCQKRTLIYRSCATCDHFFSDTRLNGPRFWERYFDELLGVSIPGRTSLS